MRHTTNTNAFWVSWEKHTRNRSICEQTGIPLYELTSKHPRPVRYCILIYKTLALFISKQKHQTIIVQNPSLVLALITNIFCYFTKRRCIVDCHNAGIHPLEGKYQTLNYLAKISIRASANTVVTNKALANCATELGGRPIILPDPLPSLSCNTASKTAYPTIVFICTWAKDEPFLDVIEAAKNIDDNIKIYITGNHEKVLRNNPEKSLLKNIEITGYLDDDKFHELLNKTWIIMDLTTRENCLVCGAYEATALEKPMILSDTVALRTYFNKGAIYTKNDAPNIAKAIQDAINKYSQLEPEIQELKKELTESWKQDKCGFLKYINT